MVTTRRGPVPDRERAADPFGGLRGPLVFVGGNILLGLAMDASAQVATLHAVLVLAVCGWAALISPRLELAVLAAAYAAQSDVLWRMTGARAPWEAGKYAVIVLLGAAFLRHVHVHRRMALPVTFVLLLVPSAAITLTQLQMGEARQLVAANLAGPLALAVAVLFFRQLVADDLDVSRILWISLGPLVAITAIATRATVRNPGIEFGTQSSFEASGDFGPNQVATAVGLGALVCLLLALLPGLKRAKLIEAGLGAWLLGQALLTFSRGGVYAFLIAAAGMGVVGMLRSGHRSRILTATVVTVLGLIATFSWVNGFSDGSLEVRYDEGGTTSRTEMAAADLELWAGAPLLGVGPGMAKYDRDFRQSAAHTEYTRMLGEHGLLGLLALIALIAMAVASYRRALGPWNRMMTVGLVLWCLATMAHSATRTAGLSYLFGLAALRVRVPPRVGRALTTPPPAADAPARAHPGPAARPG